jgi:hypothetical protein
MTPKLSLRPLPRLGLPAAFYTRYSQDEQTFHLHIYPGIFFSLPPRSGRKRGSGALGEVKLSTVDLQHVNELFH